MLFHSNRSIYLLTTLGRLAIEASLAWRASAVWFFVVATFGLPPVEAIGLQVIAGVGIFAFGFGLAQGRSRGFESLEDRYKKRGMEPDDIRIRMNKARTSANWLIAFVVLNDIAGAVYLGTVGVKGAPLIAQIAIVVMLSALSGVPFLGNEFFFALAEAIPGEGLQKMLNLGLKKNMKIKLNALDRLADQADLLPPQVVLGETWDEMMLAAAGAGGNYSTAFDQLKRLSAHTEKAAEEKRRKKQAAGGIIEDGDGNEVRVQEEQPQQKDWITGEHRAYEVVAGPQPQQLPAPEESAGAAAAPFGNGAQPATVSVPNNAIVMQLVQDSGVEPSLLYHLLESGQLENLLVRFIPGSQPSGRQPTMEPVPDVPFMRLSRLLHQTLLSREQLVALVQQHDQLASVLRSLVEKQPQYSVSGARIPTDAETE